MPSQTILIIVVCIVLLFFVALRVSLNGQIKRARARAEEQERAWRRSQALEHTQEQNSTQPE
jgi:hypothetical protein